MRMQGVSDRLGQRNIIVEEFKLNMLRLGTTE